MEISEGIPDMEPGTRPGMIRRFSTKNSGAKADRVPKKKDPHHPTNFSGTLENFVPTLKIGEVDPSSRRRPSKKMIQRNVFAIGE